MLDKAMPYRTMRDGDVLVRDASGIRAYERGGPVEAGKRPGGTREG